MDLKFEANGWQAVVADQFTFSHLRLVTQAICNYTRKQMSYADNFPPRLVIGYDARFMGRHFAHVAAEIITQNSLDVFLSDRSAPTPAVSWMISDQVTTGALMITGANESAEFNGVKYITSHMAIANEDTTSDIEAEIEALSQQNSYFQYSRTPGDIFHVNPKPAYFRQLHKLVDLQVIADAGIAITVDYLYGAASGYLRELFREVGLAIEEIQNSPLSDFGALVPALNDENLFDLCQEVRRSEAGLAVGLAIDGDGSNTQAVDASGEIVSHAHLFGLLIHDGVTRRGWRGPIVKPRCTGDFAEQVAEMHGLPVLYSNSSDFRWITAKMLEEQAMIASDGLGGYAFPGHIMERDGILAGLLTLEMVAARQQNLLDLLLDLEAQLPTNP